MPRGFGSLLVDDASSWGEALNNYDASRKTRPMPDEYYAKPARVTHAMKAAEDVTYHPVLQTFSDPAKETFAKQLEKQAVVSHLNRARDRQLAVESEYDILTMSDKRSTLKAKEPKKTRQPARDKAADYEAPRLRHPLDSAYPFNIVSNIPLTQHHYSAPTQRPSLPESEFRADAADVTKPRLQTVKALPRDFNILSNTYVENHEEKM
eukprot:6177452-Pleurochrysis_carterae.AAC.3